MKNVDSHSSEELQSSLEGWGYVSRDGDETHGKLVYEAMCMLGSNGLLEKHDAELLCSISFFNTLTMSNTQFVRACEPYINQYGIALGELNRAEWIYFITGNNAGALCVDLSSEMIKRLYDAAEGRAFDNPYFLPQLKEFRERSPRDYQKHVRAKMSNASAVYFAERIRDIYPLVANINGIGVGNTPFQVRSARDIFFDNNGKESLDKYEAKLIDVRERLNRYGIYLNAMTPYNTYFDSQDRLWIMSTRPTLVSFDHVKDWDKKWRPIPEGERRSFYVEEPEEETVDIRLLPALSENRSPKYSVF